MSLMSHPAAGWSIRRAKQPDRGAVEDVFVRSLREMAWRRSQTDELILFRQTILAAEVFVAEEAAAGIIGFVSLEGLTAYVPHLFVDEDWRLCGVGRGLLDVARDQVGQPLKLDVDRQNARAINAYSAMGWTVPAPAGRRPGDQIRLVSP
jgi:GNAT superfamily N-acetyltransferase